MSTPNVRHTIGDALKAKFPDWLIKDFEKAPEQLDRTAVLISQRTIAPLPEAPAAAFKVGLSLILIDPHQDPALAEDALDVNAIDLWELLDSSPTTNPTTATKASFQNNYLAYTFEVDAIMTKE